MLLNKKNDKSEVKKSEQTRSFVHQRRLVLNSRSPFALQEAYKTLRTNIRFFLRGTDCKKICITSSNAGEGKSITLLNLAISFAEAGKKVLLVDADLRRPALARLLGEKATPGLSNILAELCNEDETIRKEVYPNLDVIFSGDVPPNPSELLSSERMQRFIEIVSNRYDYVLIDTPPVNVVSDSCVVANLADGVLLLARQGRTRKDSVKKAVAHLQLTGANILGYILNGVDTGNNVYYSTYEQQ